MPRAHGERPESAERRDDVLGEQLDLAHRLVEGMRPWSKNQPNHSSSPSPPWILCSASISRFTWSTVPASPYFDVAKRSSVHSAGGSGVYGSSGYFSASSAKRNASQKPKPAK